MNKIKIMHDHFATPFWNPDTGANMDYNEVAKHFNVDYDLIASFSRCAAHYDMTYSDNCNFIDLVMVQNNLLSFSKQFKKLNPTKTVYFNSEEVHLED